MANHLIEERVYWGLLFQKDNSPLRLRVKPQEAREDSCYRTSTNMNVKHKEVEEK